MTLDHDEEYALVAAACDGSAEAFSVLVECYRSDVLRLALRLTRDPDDAMDVAQDTFLRAYRGIAAFRPERPFARWLLAIARNVALDALRRRRRASTSELSERRPSDDASLEELVVRSEEAASVQAALALLPVRYRRAVHLYYVERLRYREIAETLGIPIGTVKTFISRAKTQLRAELSTDVAIATRAA